MDTVAGAAVYLAARQFHGRGRVGGIGVYRRSIVLARLERYLGCSVIKINRVGAFLDIFQVASAMAVEAELIAVIWYA